MIRTAVAFGFILLIALTSNVRADGDAAAGKAKSLTCSACHGADGNSVNPEWPNLAGQHASYIESQLKAYKSGERSNALMAPMAMMLDEQAQKDLAAYYASQRKTSGTTDPLLAETGKKLYRGGNTESGVSACTACHGPAGYGVAGADMPAIAGQHAAYIETQLRLYATGERRSDKNQMMRNIAAKMSDVEIKAVASYIQGLQKSN